VPELIDEQSGILAEQHSPQALAQALERALWERSFDRAEIRARARRYTPDAVFRKYRQIYEEMLAVAA
jgi:glycosyltransferase involved in cell wall biosynthesis